MSLLGCQTLNLPEHPCSPGHNPGLLVVTSGIASQLKHLCCQILQHGCKQTGHFRQHLSSETHVDRLQSGRGPALHCRCCQVLGDVSDRLHNSWLEQGLNYDWAQQSFAIRLFWASSLTCQVHRSSRANAAGILALAEVAGDSSDRELQPSFRGPGHRLFAGSLALAATCHGGAEGELKAKPE